MGIKYLMFTFESVLSNSKKSQEGPVTSFSDVLKAWSNKKEWMQPGDIPEGIVYKNLVKLENESWVRLERKGMNILHWNIYPTSYGKMNFELLKQ